jgi:undecaprenyl diphosphate synthase
LNTKELELYIKNHPNRPAHIGIIMDGNGRWAQKKGLPRIAGHNRGIDSVHEIVETCGELGIKVLTLYTFSIENWKRPRWEVSALMDLMVRTVRRELQELIEKNVKITIIGHLQDLPNVTRISMQEAVEKTKNNSGLILNLAISYGGRSEIKDAVVKISKKVIAGEILPEEISENLIQNHLHTADLPDPDLIIRTSGEFRVSNFLLWQIAYSEIYVTEKHWPDFKKPDLLLALESYLKRERRFGMVSDQLATINSRENS